ncbi:MAG: hypothetical protein ACYDGR_06895 [Candidatus Dormibacteria bacterium]
MRHLPFSTRARAALLRTFRGRGRRRAQWSEATVAAGPPLACEFAGLRITSNPVGPRRTAVGEMVMVYEVGITAADPGNARWSSRYGLAQGEASAAAIESALDELHEAYSDRARWMERCTAGMSEDEAEAIRDSPALLADIAASNWLGPILHPFAADRARAGRWLPSGVSSPVDSPRDAPA